MMAFGYTATTHIRCFLGLRRTVYWMTTEREMLIVFEDDLPFRR
jgi:hypothetical protein